MDKTNHSGAQTLWQICGINPFVEAVDALAIMSATNTKGAIIYANDRFSEISGYSRAELIGQNHRILNSGYHPSTFFKEMWATITRGKIWRGQIKNRAKDGSFYWVDTAITPFKDDLGRIQGYTSIRADITEEKAQNLQLALALNNMARGLSMFDAQARLIISNNLYRDIYQLPHELTQPGTAFLEIIRYYEETETGRDGKGDVEKQSKWIKRYVAELARGRSSSHVQHLKSGRTILVNSRPLPNGGWVDLAEDVTERERFEAKIEHLAHYDALTDLANRALLDNRLKLELARLCGVDKLAFHLVDLDSFKDVNDRFGHQVGDQVLKTFAERARGLCGGSDIVARTGGDEFAIVQTEITADVAAASLAERLIEISKQPYDIGGRQIMIGASIGVAIAPADGDTADELIKSADLALYQAKGRGGRAFCFFEKELNDRLQSRSALAADLHKALAAGEIELHYQPIVRLDGNQMAGAEVLMRWHHPKRGLIPPIEFIPLAEESDLIFQLGDWAIRQACNQVAAWPDPIKVAVNVSPRQFEQSGFVAMIAGALAASGLRANRLEIEITETIFLNDSEANIAALRQLHDLGVRIVLDDFGTGYSSLCYLQRFALDKIKIDRAFIKEIITNDETIKIVRAIANLARSLGIETTAEGVETKEQLDAVRLLGCDEIQGYLIGRPVPADDFEHLYLPRIDVTPSSHPERNFRDEDDKGEGVADACSVIGVPTDLSVSRRQPAEFEAFDLLPAQIAVLDQQGAIIFTNNAWEQTAAGRLAEHPWNYLQECTAAAERGCADGRVVGTAINKILRGELGEYVETYSCPFDRRHHWFQISVRRLRSTDREIGAIVMHTNVTSLQHDHLTGLANRALFEAQALYTIDLARQNASQVGFAVIDLDGFKPINDQFGHVAGDEVLVDVAQRLSSVVTGDQLIARVGGDEFGVVTGIGCNEVTLSRISRDLRFVFKKPYLVHNTKWHLSASVGTALFPTDGETLKLLLKSADSRMYGRKRALKSQREKWIA